MPPTNDLPPDIRAFIPPLRCKSCQKAEWPTHKAICVDTTEFIRSLPASTNPTQPPLDISTFGYHSIPALCTALQNFGEAHEWSFSALTKVFVAAKGGIAWSQDPQKMFTVELVPVTTLPGIRERNPSRTFRVKSFYSTAVHDHVAANPLGAMDEWVKQEPLRQAAFETYGEDPYYAGLLPLNLGINGVNVTFMQYIPQFWPVPPSRPMPQLASDEAKKILMQDVAALAYCAINEGIPLRATGPEPPGVGFAYPGRTAKTRLNPQLPVVLENLVRLMRTPSVIAVLRCEENPPKPQLDSRLEDHKGEGRKDVEMDGSLRWPGAAADAGK
ncbi:hypothetical protein GSI_07316 [Ganoderma sinense ZZ0214-1]|uniref:Uncharacterized protein n=1 Tax=Ganoderma sinense ZZ0214-1 TaxID=1077348 RepID=A0A2G8SA17_9APHY|nr:hypothetical protein GSI_07316 [Ganoderma sinense ZZ0214-1]